MIPSLAQRQLADFFFELCDKHCMKSSVFFLEAAHNPLMVTVTIKILEVCLYARHTETVATSSQSDH